MLALPESTRTDRGGDSGSGSGRGSDGDDDYVSSIAE